MEIGYTRLLGKLPMHGRMTFMMLALCEARSEH
jgi:hypothetical protein